MLEVSTGLTQLRSDGHAAQTINLFDPARCLPWRVLFEVQIPPRVLHDLSAIRHPLGRIVGLPETERAVFERASLSVKPVTRPLIFEAVVGYTPKGRTIFKAGAQRSFGVGVTFAVEAKKSKIACRPLTLLC